MNKAAISCSPPEIKEEAEAVVENILPLTSKKRYEDAYNKFILWKNTKNVTSLSETVLLAYFNDLKSKYVSSTLWSQFSMLKSTLNIKHNVNIGQYPRLIALLKRASDHYQPKKSKTLTSENVNKFMQEAPDKKHLLTKVAMAIALSGACRREELWKMKVDDFKDLNSAFLITLPDTETKLARNFTITGQFYELCKKYISLRPTNLPERRFFLNYQCGKCTRQVIGINKLGTLPMQIAKFLRLPHPEKYTGHCFRRSSTTILADSGGNLLGLKRHGDVEGNKRWVNIRRKGRPDHGSPDEAAIERSDVPSSLESCPSTKQRYIGAENTNMENIEAEENPCETFQENDIQNGSYSPQSEMEIKIEEETFCSDHSGDNDIKELDNVLLTRKESSSYSEECLKPDMEHHKTPYAFHEQDETDLFFASMAKIVKKLPESERAQLRMEIGILVGNAELKHLSNSRE